MKNITLKVDDETYRKARIRAAEAGTSVSALVRDFLASLPPRSADQEHADRVADLKELYARAEKRASPRTEPLKPLSREEIYAERLR